VYILRLLNSTTLPVDSARARISNRFGSVPRHTEEALCTTSACPCRHVRCDMFAA
jgi:endonuclease III